jgi:hypothetical protein
MSPPSFAHFVNATNRVWFNSRTNCAKDMVWYRAWQTKNLTNELVFDFCIHQLVSRF